MKKNYLLWIISAFLFLFVPTVVYANDAQYATIELDIPDGADIVDLSGNSLRDVLKVDGAGAYLCEVGTRLEFTIPTEEGYDLVYYCYGFTDNNGEEIFGGRDIAWDADKSCLYIDVDSVGNYDISVFTQKQATWEENLMRTFGFAAGTKYFSKDEQVSPSVIYNYVFMNLNEYVNDDWYFELTYDQYMEKVATYFENYGEMKDYLIARGEYDEAEDKVLIFTGGSGGGVEWVLTSTYEAPGGTYVLQGLYLNDSHTSGVPYDDYMYIVHPVELTLSKNSKDDWKILSFEMGTYYISHDELCGDILWTVDENGNGDGKWYYRLNINEDAYNKINLTGAYTFENNDGYWYSPPAAGGRDCYWEATSASGYTCQVQVDNLINGKINTSYAGNKGVIYGDGEVTLTVISHALFNMDAANANVSVLQGLTDMLDGTYAYAQGAAVELKVTPKTGYKVTSVTVGDVKATYISASGTYVVYPSFKPGTIKVTTERDCSNGGHSWNSGKVTTQATCTSTGVKTYTCTVCSATKTETLSKKEHTWNSNYTVDKNPTCSAEGAKSIYCSVCKAKKEGSTVAIEKKAHSFGGYTVIEKATFTYDGFKTATCKTCGYKKEVYIKKVTAALNTSRYEYTTQRKDPIPVVEDTSGKTLVKGTDYTAKYTNSERLKVGVYKVEVTLKGTDYKGSKTLYFYILPKAPEDTGAVLYEYNKVKISWDKSYNADGYYVYYKLADSNNAYTKLGSTTNTYYKTGALTEGKKYTFKVVPYLKGESGHELANKFSTASCQLLKKLSAPTITKSSATKVKMSWTEIYGENGYEISRSTSKTGTANKKTTTKNSITLEPSRNKVWYYKVRAYRGAGSNRVYTPWSTVTSFDLRYVSAVRDVKANLSGDYNDVKVTWNKSKEGANKYFVYQKKGSEAYKLAGSTTGTSFTIKNLTDGVKHTFKVVPAYMKDGKTVVEGTSKTATATTLKKMAAPTFERTSSSKVKVKWKKVEGASGYQISKTLTASSTKVVETVSLGTTTSKKIDAKKGLTAFIKVRAYKKVGTKKIYGPWSDATEIHYSK